MILRNGPAAEQFLAKGIPVRDYFPHYAAVIRKLYPDSLLLLEGRGATKDDLLRSQFFQLNLYSDHLSGLPEDVFADPQVNWHNQQLGRKGLIAAAGLCLRDSSLTITVMQSDVCQQLYRNATLRASAKTQLEKRFGAWHRLLFNAILSYAIELSASAVYSPTADWILASTRRDVQPHLFRRIYDWPDTFYDARRVARNRADYWEVPLESNADRVLRMSPCDAVAQPSVRTICVFHDTEENADTDISVEECRRNLTKMLDIERRADVRATYDIVGALFQRKRDEIRAAGPHALAFHSFDHDVTADNQLRRCREIDLQLRGYRPPRSVITPELSEYSLAYYNFEWLASSCSSLGGTTCSLNNGIVTIPIAMDDYPLATRSMELSEWRRTLIDKAATSEFFAFGLHDCYAHAWIDFYESLLEEIAQLGTVITADELCDLTYWQQG